MAVKGSVHPKIGISVTIAHCWSQWPSGFLHVARTEAIGFPIWIALMLNLKWQRSWFIKLQWNLGYAKWCPRHARLTSDDTDWEATLACLEPSLRYLKCCLKIDESHAFNGSGWWLEARICWMDSAHRYALRTEMSCIDPFYQSMLYYISPKYLGKGVVCKPTMNLYSNASERFVRI